MLQIALLEPNKELALQLKEKLELHSDIKVVACFHFQDELKKNLVYDDSDLVLLSLGLGFSSTLELAKELESKEFKVALMSAFSTFQQELLCFATLGEFIFNKASDLPNFHEELFQRQTGNTDWSVHLIRELHKRSYLTRTSEDLFLLLESEKYSNSPTYS
ncbi:MAG: hypothetical protein ACPGED_11775, partial [Flavobacteriales bacterium]